MPGLPRAGSSEDDFVQRGWVGASNRQSRRLAQISRGPLLSVLETESRRSSDVVVHEKAVRQSAIEFRPKDADVNIPLRCKLPVDNTRDRVQRTGALRVLFAVAEHDPAAGRAEVGMLGV